MTREELEKRYRDLILPESRDPYHFAPVESADLLITAYNPICGDKFNLYLDIDSGTIRDTHFHGFGCAISKASSSLMMRRIKGMELSAARNYVKSFLLALDSGEFDPFDENIRVLLELRNFEGRLDCIKLSWEEILNHL